MKKISTILLAAAIVCMMAVLPVSAKEKQIKIGLSISDFETERWHVEKDIMTKLAAEKGAKLIHQVQPRCKTAK